jgi:hypothetical protein
LEPGDLTFQLQGLKPGAFQALKPGAFQALKPRAFQALKPRAFQALRVNWIQQLYSAPTTSVVTLACAAMYASSSGGASA